jgi:hypothetical protein
LLWHAVPVIAAAALIAGCGGSGSPAAGGGPSATPTTIAPPENGVATLPGAQILTRAKAALAKATSVHVVGSLPGGGAELRFDVRIRGTAGGYGAISLDNHKLEVIRIAQTAYLRGDEKFWVSEIGNASLAKRLAGRYVKASVNDPQLNQLVAFTNVATLADMLPKAGLPLTKRGRTVVDGVLTMALSDDDPTERGTVYVALQGQPYPVRLSATDAKTKASTSIDFTDYNRPVTLRAPKLSQIIDAKTLGGS